MELQFFCPRWGSEALSWNEFLLKAKNAGYNGIEYGIANNTSTEELERVWEKAAQYQMLMIPQHYETSAVDFNKHHDQYAAWLQKLEPFNAVKLNSQTGRDIFTFEQNKQLIDLAKSFAERTGVAVYHETHRGKFSFAAHITKEYLLKIPYLQLTLDASHWVNVAESFLGDQAETIELATARTGHIHARVGFPEGPQVTDPRAPEWADAVNTHVVWWLKAAKSISESNKIVTVTPEFGPYPYLIQQPYTRQPIANQWDINVYMMKMLKEKLNGI